MRCCEKLPHDIHYLNSNDQTMIFPPRPLSLPVIFPPLQSAVTEVNPKSVVVSVCVDI